MGTRSQSEKSVSGHSKSRPFWSCLTLLFLLFVGPQSALADTRLVVRDSLGLTGILNLCGLLGGCSTVRGLGDPGGYARLAGKGRGAAWTSGRIC